MTTWATTEDVALLLGGTPDETLLELATTAANEWAFRRRAASDYTDDPDVSPGPDVTMGVALMAKALYLERGAVDGFASFQEVDGFTPATISLGQVYRMLGVGKPVVF